MFFVRCPFCHKLVFRLFYEGHKRQHTKLRDDGQMTEHITVHPEGRYQGSLKGVPTAYRHDRCGGVTGMPEEIVRSYLVNPFLYSGGSFCCGCEDYRPYRELFWVETGECLDDYFQKLQDQYLREHGEPPPKTRV